jgi:hypothetical protein
MFRLIRNQQGNATMFITMVSLVLGASVITIMDKGKEVTKVMNEAGRIEEGKFALDKLKAMSNFMISSNLIVCKEDPFTGDTEGFKCKWTGFQTAGGDLKRLEKSKLGLDNGRYDEKGFLVFEVDTSRLVDPEEMADGENYEITNLKGEIGFKLYDLEGDTLDIAKNFGSIPLNNLKADADRTAILVKSKVVYQNQFMIKTVVNEDGSTSRVKGEARKKELKSYFGVRRPIAIPQVTINEAKCKMACESAMTINDSPSCRGEQSADAGEEVGLYATTRNLGPGVLYKLKMAKHIKYNEDLLPNVGNPEPVAVDAMPGKDYLLPGEEIQWTDSVQCHTIQTQVTQTVRRSTWATDANGNPACLDGNTIVTCPTGSTEISQHSEPAGTISYKLDISQVPTDWTLDTMRLRLGDRQWSFNRRVPSEHRVTSVARIEPARIVTTIAENGDIPMEQETQTVIEYIPTH